MRTAARILVSLLVILVVVSVLGLTLLMRQGMSARAEPSAPEAYVARRLRRLAVPAEARNAPNPIPSSPDVLAQAREHFADHCAICHANDGTGNTEIGRNTYPPAPDMRLETTQSLTDGELYYIINNGIRFTAMPAWGGPGHHEEQDNWKLVHFIRHLPRATPQEIEEMKQWNPVSPHEAQEGHSSQHEGAEHAHDQKQEHHP